VSDALWYRANEVVDGRRVFKEPIRGWRFHASVAN
jgi:hypothetical protein